MARPSPIVVGLSALLAALLALAVFIIARPRPPARAPDERPATPQAAPPPQSRAEPGAVDRREGDVSVIVQPGPYDAFVPPVDSGAAAGPSGRPARLVANHNQRLQEADERAFAALNLPEQTRAAIRHLNEEQRRRTEPRSGRADGPGASEVAAAAAARADALRFLLGTDGAQTFDQQERAAVGRLRGKYRFQWGRQLRD